MPELPEVETVVRTLRPLVRGRSISTFTAYWERTVEPQSPEDIARAVAGRTINDVSRRAKQIMLHLDNRDRISIHLRMTGELRFVQSPDTIPAPNREKYLRVRIRFEDESQLLFYDVRKFGRIRLYSPASWEDLDRSLGIEPLSDEFTPERLHEILASRRRQLKPLLLDQRVIAGLGNIYVDEALFRAGLHPLTRSDMVCAAEANRLHGAIVTVLDQAIGNRGTTLRDYRTGTGEPGENLAALLVYGSPDGAPCPRCGNPLRRLVIGQRGTVFCAQCQPVRVAGQST